MARVNFQPEVDRLCYCHSEEVIQPAEANWMAELLVAHFLLKLAEEAAASGRKAERPVLPADPTIRLPGNGDTALACRHVPYQLGKGHRITDSPLAPTPSLLLRPPHVPHSQYTYRTQPAQLFTSGHKMRAFPQVCYFPA